MPRNSKCKCVGSLPRFSSFVPADRRDEGHQLRLSVEEFETIRLIDYEGLNQELCAERMGVGRGTVQALYAEARKKTARFLVEGARLEISGGTYRLEAPPPMFPQIRTSTPSSFKKPAKAPWPVPLVSTIREERILPPSVS